MTRRGVAGVTTGTVYGLVDPRDRQIRYVGATMQTLPARLKGHLSHPSARVWEWLEGLREDGLIPEITPLMPNVPAAQLWSTESAEIERIISSGGGLLNREAAHRDSPILVSRRTADEMASWAVLAGEAVALLGGPLPPGDIPAVIIPAGVWDLMADTTVGSRWCMPPGCRGPAATPPRGC